MSYKSNFDLLHPRVTTLIYIFEAVGVTITSAYRTLEDNSRVGGHPRSWHLSGRALDVVSDNKRLVNLLGTFFGFQVIDEGDHIHLEYETPGVY